MSVVRMLLLLTLIILSLANTARIRRTWFDCPAVKTQFCTRIYQRTCGMISLNQRKVFANKCLACHDPQVTKWSLGGC